MLDVSTLDLSTLPSVALEEQSQLPTTPCIYFCLHESGEVLYVGKSLCPRQRWASNHHRLRQMKEIGDVTIAWLIVNSVNSLQELEEELIARFTPRFNRVKSSAPRASKTGLKVLRNTLRQFIEKRAMTPYTLSKCTSLPLNTIYRLVNDPCVIPTGKVMDIILNSFDDAYVTDILGRADEAIS
jgi:hypothetical protein